MDWTFNSKQIAESFDSHVREQLPWYDLASETVAIIARNYLRQNGVVYDIGCSTGNIAKRMVSLIQERACDFYGIDTSGDMICRQQTDWGEAIHADALDYHYEPFSVAVCFLTLSFLTVDEREALIVRLRGACESGGVIIVVDKFEAPGGYAGTVLRRITTAWKLINGASPSDILSKELSLSGVQRPLNRDELPSDAVRFFQLGEFQGWIIQQP
jgi:tRNA (cmo5U34)-methyltransferase